MCRLKQIGGQPLLSLNPTSQLPPNFTSGQNVAFTPAVSPSFIWPSPVPLLWANLPYKEAVSVGRQAPQVRAAWGRALLLGRDACSHTHSHSHYIHLLQFCWKQLTIGFKAIKEKKTDILPSISISNKWLKAWWVLQNRCIHFFFPTVVGTHASEQACIHAQK